LLLLRLSSASLVAFGLGGAQMSIWAAAGSIAVAIALLAGVCTRLAALVCVLSAAAAFSTTGGMLGWVMGLQALNAIALSILGAGAYSIDARLYGRRVVIRE